MCHAHMAAHTPCSLGSSAASHFRYFRTLRHTPPDSDAGGFPVTPQPSSVLEIQTYSPACNRTYVHHDLSRAPQSTARYIAAATQPHARSGAPCIFTIPSTISGRCHHSQARVAVQISDAPVSQLPKPADGLLPLSCGCALTGPSWHTASQDPALVCTPQCLTDIGAQRVAADQCPGHCEHLYHGLDDVAGTRGCHIMQNASQIVLPCTSLPLTRCSHTRGRAGADEGRVPFLPPVSRELDVWAVPPQPRILRCGAGTQPVPRHSPGQGGARVRGLLG